MNPSIDSLVLYKGQPAVVRQAADKKLTIELPDGERVSVRPKDVVLLHPGPAPHPRQLPPSIGDPLTAWELLQGGTTTLAELAELSFGAYSPATAWAAWGLVADGLYFSGAPEAIIAHTADKVADIQAAREAKAADERDWAGFAARVAGGGVALEDERYLADVIPLALGRTETSRTLRRLGLPQTPESAHTFLLVVGRWQPADNPYPARFGVSTERLDDSILAEAGLGQLPDEPRRDLTHLPALAIDDEGSNDPDDALSIEEGRLWVHVADVGALVMPDDAVDREACSRAANLYLPDGTVHMLPETLTSRLALGLQPISPALSFALAPRPDGDFKLLEIVPSWVRVTRVTYEQAESQLDENPYRALQAVVVANHARRIANGAVEIELPEVKIKAAIDGTVSIRPLPSLRSRALVREAMLMVGEAVGRLATAQNITLAFTVQEPPLSDDGLPADLTAAGPSVMWAKRRSMQRSRPSTAPGRHAGLGLDVYVQATSPLRRYLDLLAHQQLRAYLRGGPLLDTTAITLRIGTADAIAGAVRAAERQSNQHWTLVYLLQNPHWQGEGIVVEQKPGRDVVVIPSLAWETELYRRPSRPLDSSVSLAVESVDLATRTARFKVL